MVGAQGLEGYAADGGMLEWGVVSRASLVRAHYPENWTFVEAGVISAEGRTDNP